MSFAEFRFTGQRISAKYDGFLAKPDRTVYIIDNKIPPREQGREPWDGHKNQALAGALAWASEYSEYDPTNSNSTPIFAVLRNRDAKNKDITTNWYWQKQLTLKDSKYINQILDDIQLWLIDHSKCPTNRVTQNKCRACEYNNQHLCNRHQ
jgi:hypothetical protein